MGSNSGLLGVRLATNSLKHGKALKGNKRPKKFSERGCNFYISPNIINDQIYNDGLGRLSGAHVGVTCGGSYVRWELHVVGVTCGGSYVRWELRAV
jgi:hypothetical protein